MNLKGMLKHLNVTPKSSRTKKVVLCYLRLTVPPVYLYLLYINYNPKITLYCWLVFVVVITGQGFKNWQKWQMIISWHVLQGGMQYNPQSDGMVHLRKQNLVKIEQLRQTLEAAQQQEQQYKTQMEVTFIFLAYSKPSISQISLWLGIFHRVILHLCI